MPCRRSFAHRVHRPASLRVADPGDGLIRIVFTTGADVTRSDPFLGTYIERLLTAPENVLLDRLNAGAPFLDTHDAYSLGSVIGRIVPGSASMKNGNGEAIIQLSKSARAADTVQDVKDGVICNVSVGYNVLAFDRVEATDESPAVMTATLWQPLEVSAVPIPADPGAQISARTRSAAGLEVHPCIVTQADSNKENDPMAITERQAGYAWASRLRGKPVDADALARLGKADDAAFQSPHSAQTAIAAERAAAEACFARAFPGRARRSS